MKSLFNKKNPSHSKLLFCLIISFFAGLSFSVSAAISTVASEQSGTTAPGVVSHVGAGALDSVNNCGSISPSIPAGSNGDLLIALVNLREEAASIAQTQADEAWTQYYADNVANLEVEIYYKIADGTDTITLTSSGTGNCRSMIAQVARFSGVDNASPFETAAPLPPANVVQQNADNIDTGTQTTTSATAMTIVATFINDNRTVTEADGFTESFDSTSTLGRDSAISLNYRQESTAGAKSITDWDTSNTDSNPNYGVIFALTPDPTSEAITINVPAGTTTDDVMLAAIAVGPSSTGIAAPAGWTLINRQDQAIANSNSQAVYYRIATASEPTSYTWTFSGGAINGTAGGIVTYRGVDTSNPIDISGGNATASSTSHTANSVVTTVVNTMVISIHSFSSSEAWTSPVSPVGMTEQVDIASLATPNANGISLTVNDVIQATAGATGNITATVAGNADTGVAQIVALTPILISNNITVTFAGGPIQRILAGSISLADASLGDPEASATSVNGADSAAITTNITTIADNAWLIDVVGKPRGNHSYTAGVGQTERWDNELGNNNNGATGAMSTKEVSPAGLDSMTQTHSSATRRNAHAVMSVAPIDTSSTISFDAVASATANSANNISWTHTLSTSDTPNTKLVVGVTYRMTAACGGASITGITYGSLPLVQVAATSVSDGTRCQYSELWYIDLTNIIVSTDANSDLGGQAMDQDEAVEYNAATDTGTLFFDDATFDTNARLDALHQFDNGNLAISVAGNGEAISGNAIPNGSVALVFPSTTSGIYSFSSILFDESNFTSGDETIDAVYVRDNGNIVLSTAGNANLPGLGAFDDDDIVEWDGTNATLVFNIASITGAANNWDVDGVHFLNDDPMLILFSLYNNRTIGPTTYENGDVLLYNRNTSTLSIFFSEDNFPANEDVDAFTLAIPPVNPPALRNFVLTASATASTCTSTEITIEAISTNNTVFDYDGTITLSTSTNNGDWDERDHLGALSATNPATNTVTDTTADDGLATYVFAGAPDGGRVGLFLSNDHAETLQVTVVDLTAPGSAVTTDITFSDNVFEITPTTCTGATCPGTGSYEVVAARNHIFQVDMMRNDGTSCGVATGYNNAAQTLEGWIVRHGDDPAGTLPTLTEETSALGDGAAPGADNVTLDFSAGGTATLTLETTDVGKYELFLRDTSMGFADVNIDGSSGAANQITTRPFGLGFTNITGLVANPGATTPGGTRFATAGSSYSADVGAYRYDAADDTDSDGVPDTNRDVADNGNTLTPSYAWDTNVIVGPLTFIPAAGTAGALTFTTPNGGANLIGQLDFSGGTESVSDFAYFEVGSMRMQGDATNFLNSGISVTGTSGVVGRFGADQFTFMTNAPELDPGCGNFTYVDQPFDYTTAPLITARATAADGTTILTNYNDFGGPDNWWLLPRTPFSAGSGVDMSYTDLALPTDITIDFAATDYSPNTGTTGSGGQQLFTLNGPFSYAKDTPPISEQAPFNSDIRLDFSVTDTDGATGSYLLSTDAALPPDQTITFNDPEQRWGRLNVLNAAGSELLDIAVPLRTEYFDGNAFITNIDDDCTVIEDLDTDVSLVNPDTGAGAPQPGNTAMVIGNSSTSITSGAPINIMTGVESLVFSAPDNGDATADTGFVEIEVDVTETAADTPPDTTGSEDPWLLYDWDGDGDFDDNPTGRATFGIFSGPRQFIYIREPW